PWRSRPGRGLHWQSRPLDSRHRRSSLHPLGTSLLCSSGRSLRLSPHRGATLTWPWVLGVVGPLAGSGRSFKYRLAFVVAGRGVVRCDNETGKGDQRHFRETEVPFTFTTVDRLVADFVSDTSRWR